MINQSYPTHLKGTSKLYRHHNFSERIELHSAQYFTHQYTDAFLSPPALPSCYFSYLQKPSAGLFTFHTHWTWPPRPTRISQACLYSNRPRPSPWRLFTTPHAKQLCDLEATEVTQREPRLFGFYLHEYTGSWLYQMDLETIEVSRERAVSSEPCSARPKPFDDSERSARKRQRVSSGSRSRSADTGTASTTYVTTPKEHSPSIEISPTHPQTPARALSNKIIPEPTSSKVTINLRSSKTFRRTSSPPLSPTTPSKMSSPNQLEKLDIEQDVHSVAAPTETVSSSSSTLGSPKIELVIEDDDIEYGQSPPVAIIEDDELLLEGDPVLDFPYASTNEPLTATLRKIIHFFEYGMPYLYILKCRT